VCQGNGCRSYELGLQRIFGAGGIAQHAVDAHGKLAVLHQLRRRLLVLTLFNGLLVLGDQIRLDPLELVDEVIGHSHQIAFNREVGQWFDLYHHTNVVAQERVARQLGLAIDHHAAAAAHGHVARPAVGQCGIDGLLDGVERVQHDPLFMAFHFIFLEIGLGILFRVIPHHFQLDQPLFELGHLWSPE
jgi:hypothetical protein